MIPLDNKELRLQALAARRSLSEEARWRFSKQICDTLLSCLGEAKHIALYMAEEDEVDLSFLFLPLLKEKHLYLPVCKGKGEMDMRVFHSASVLTANRYGIPEPAQEAVVDPALLDVIVVPMVCYDEAGNRLGHGMGFYDRYLKQSRAKRIGVAFSCQKADAIHSASHDVKMDLIIDETAVYSFPSQRELFH